MMMPAASGHFFRGNDTPLERFTADVFKLNGRVTDVEVILEHVVQIHENAGALRRRNIGDLHVACERP